MARQSIDGVLLLDKPAGMSSAQALARAKRALNAVKAGHTGTLDPLATGLLPLCFGEATKFAGDLLEAAKTYEARILLGATTTTGDSEGEVLERRDVIVTAQGVEAALARFRGEIEQVPPMYSALKRDGRPLYDYARRGETVHRESRQVVIHELVLLRTGEETVDVRVACSKGTYVRTLAEDIGAALGCGAHLVALRRTQVGELTLDDAVALEALEAEPFTQRVARLQRADRLIQGLPVVHLSAELARRFCQGQRLVMEHGASLGEVRVYAASARGDVLLGVAELGSDLVLRPKRIIVLAEPLDLVAP
jgi:tRNA pseudouridine55 synthase